MDQPLHDHLVAAGWTVGSTTDFLGLSAAEAALSELQLALAAALRETRLAQGLTQAQVARRLGSSQSRVAKMEAGDPSVSLDLLLKALLTLGVTRQELGELVGHVA